MKKLNFSTLSGTLIAIFLSRLLVLHNSVNISESIIFIGILSLHAYAQWMSHLTKPDPSSELKAQVDALQKEMLFVKEQVNSAQLASLKSKNPFSPKF